MHFEKMQVATKLWVFILLVIGSISAVAVIGLVRSASILVDGRAAQMQPDDAAERGRGGRERCRSAEPA